MVWLKWFVMMDDYNGFQWLQGSDGLSKSTIVQWFVMGSMDEMVRHG